MDEEVTPAMFKVTLSGKFRFSEDDVWMLPGQDITVDQTTLNMMQAKGVVANAEPA